MKAGSGYTITQIRDAAWVKEMGHTPTVMDYSQYNFVAQPEDGSDPRDLVARIGRYDTWAIVQADPRRAHAGRRVGGAGVVDA